MISLIGGGACAAKGFQAAGVHCGVRRNTAKKDLMLLVCEKRAAAAAVYTRNLVKGAPILVTKENLSDGYARAMVCNSGNANTCNHNGIEIAKGMCALVSQAVSCDEKDVIVASTGVIGQPMSLFPFESGIPAAAKALGADGLPAAQAVMTTDTFPKEAAARFTVGGKEAVIGGFAKGSGMIAPNMATMLCFLTTDASITPAMLQKALSEDVKTSFNMLVIDGDTSTNDMCCVMASGLAGNPTITAEGRDFTAFKEALGMVTQELCGMLAKDGEGASRKVVCAVTGAKDDETARACAKSVVSSSLVKAMLFGADANWGRVLCALGYAGADIDIHSVGVSFKSQKGVIEVCRGGEGVDFSEEKGKEILSEKEVAILITLGEGEGSATAWGCDLTYDYVKINGDYRS